MKRLFLIVLDSCGIGQMPDAGQFGDRNVNTLRSCAGSGILHIPNLEKLGIGNLDGVDYLKKEEHPTGAVARLAEMTRGEWRGRDIKTGKGVRSRLLLFVLRETKRELLKIRLPGRQA